jgi:hypothetical protein
MKKLGKTELVNVTYRNTRCVNSLDDQFDAITQNRERFFQRRELHKANMNNNNDMNNYRYSIYDTITIMLVLLFLLASAVLNL